MGYDTSIFKLSTLNEYMKLERKYWRNTRNRIYDLLVEGGDDRLKNNEVST